MEVVVHDPWWKGHYLSCLGYMLEDQMGNGSQSRNHGHVDDGEVVFHGHRV